MSEENNGLNPEEKLHNIDNDVAASEETSPQPEPVNEHSADPDDLAREFEAREAALNAALAADDGGDAFGYSHWSDIPKAPKPSRLHEDAAPQVTEDLLDYYKEKAAAADADADEKPDAETAGEGGEGEPSAPNAEKAGDPSARADALAQDDAADGESETPSGPDYVAMTLSAGIAPLEMRFAQINSCYRRRPIAYRSFTYINSMLEGVIPPEKYSYAAEADEKGERLARWSISKAIDAVRAFEAAGRHVEFVTARCPASLTRELDLYAWMKELLASKRFETPSKLCLEFPRTILYDDPERARMALLSLKLLKVRSMMTGCGERDCPVTALLELPFDMVLLSPRISALSDNRDKSAVFTGFIGYLRSLPVEVIGDGIYNDEQISIHSRADCFGYTPSAGYAGAVEHGRLRMTLEEAVSQKEDDV